MPFTAVAPANAGFATHNRTRCASGCDRRRSHSRPCADCSPKRTQRGSSPMHGTHGFSVADLRSTLFSVVDRHEGDVDDFYMNLGSGGLSTLADQLNKMTGNLNLSDDLDAMAQIMAMIVI